MQEQPVSSLQCITKLQLFAVHYTRLLKDLEYRLRVNHKKLKRGSPPDRDAQFNYIAAQRETFARADLPIISIDAKKRELVGNFKNQGEVALWH